jgi:hypothetical protein
MPDPVIIAEFNVGGSPVGHQEIQVPVDPMCWPVELCAPIEVDGVVTVAQEDKIKDRAWGLMTAIVAFGGSPRDSEDVLRWEHLMDFCIDRANQFESL